MSETTRSFGFEDRISKVQTLKPQAITDDTPVLSSAIDRRSYPRKRALLMANVTEAGATAHTVAFTVTESATSDGEYTAATVSGTLTALSADGTQFASIRPNWKKPFIKVTATGSHADVNVIVSADILFMD